MYPYYPYYSKKIECEEKPLTFPPQAQDQQPGFEYLMNPRPISENLDYIGSGKLEGKTAIISGGDSGIGRAVGYAFAKEGADLVIPYYNEHQDAEETKRRIESFGRRCLLIPGDLTKEKQNEMVVSETLETFGKIDVVVNNLAVQYPQVDFLKITAEQFDKTFKTNIYAYFYMAKEAVPHLKQGASIINTASVTAYKGQKELVDYSATKGAIVSFTRSLSLNLIPKGIRVNSVAPGPVWTPLTVSSFDADRVSKFGLQSASKRAAQPFELAAAYVYLASDDSRYVTGETLHVNGGQMVTA
ncbi:SDR family oxidoreductase [Bacillus sp. SJS]|uniref:SDR family oxidoreductase n=1 Tax=Bacillus sp. SJS TaxID=1423321 RepID=UPI0004DCCDA4|nr:SDR family oxidoreductase [Bacillus sp. SJS]KZZ84145.1 NAD(P)-dependent oxidoreductase [Bacillus sp. SJS]